MTARYVALGLLTAAALGGLFWHQLGWAVTTAAVVCSWLVGVNAAAFVFYGLDKRRAVRQGARVPETALLTLAAAGGSLGAYAGMGLFRHKTITGSFRALFWLIVAAQLVLLAWSVRASFWGE
jgi:uncharacterized membrane protein YsdA (DUF1294 family)